jgi:hypothetical protein
MHRFRIFWKRIKMSSSSSSSSSSLFPHIERIQAQPPERMKQFVSKFCTASFDYVWYCPVGCDFTVKVGGVDLIVRHLQTKLCLDSRKEYHCNACEESFFRRDYREGHRLLACPNLECEKVRPVCTPCKDHENSNQRLYHHSIHDKLLLYTSLPEVLIHLVRECLQGYSGDCLSIRKRKREEEDKAEEEEQDKEEH